MKKYYSNLYSHAHKTMVKNQKKYNMMSYNHNIIKMKAFESLYYFTFTLRKNKAHKSMRSLKKWSTDLQVKTFYSLKAYASQQKAKKAKYDEILKDRKRAMRQ